MIRKITILKEVVMILFGDNRRSWYRHKQTTSGGNTQMFYRFGKQVIFRETLASQLLITLGMTESIFSNTPAFKTILFVITVKVRVIEVVWLLADMRQWSSSRKGDQRWHYQITSSWSGLLGIEIMLFGISRFSVTKLTFKAYRIWV